MNRSANRILLALGVLGAFALVGCTDQVGEEIHRPGMEDPFIVDPSGTGVRPQGPNQASADKDSTGGVSDPAGSVRQLPDPLTARDRDSKGKTADAHRRMLDDPGRVTTWLRDPSAKRVVTKRDREKGREEVEVYTQEPSITAPADPNKVYKLRVRKRVYLKDAKSDAADRRRRLGEEKDAAADEDRPDADAPDEAAKDQRPKRRTP